MLYGSSRLKPQSCWLINGFLAYLPVFVDINKAIVYLLLSAKYAKYITCRRWQMVVENQRELHVEFSSRYAVVCLVCLVT